MQHWILRKMVLRGLCLVTFGLNYLWIMYCMFQVYTGCAKNIESNSRHLVLSSQKRKPFSRSISNFNRMLLTVLSNDINLYLLICINYWEKFGKLPWGLMDRLAYRIRWLTNSINSLIKAFEKIKERKEIWKVSRKR